MAWKKILVNTQNVETETGKAVLFKMRHNSDYDGYKFWHPAKCVRPGSNSSELEVSFTDNWEFKLFKNGQGKYNSREKIDEIAIDAETMESQW